MEINLGIKRETWRQEDTSFLNTDQEFKENRLRVLERDSFTCQGDGCQFHVKPLIRPDGRKTTYLEVHHVDHNHQNNQLENLITLCPFCHSCFHLGHLLPNETGQLVSRGTLIYLPNLSQGELNRLTRLILIGQISIENGHPFQAKLHSAYASLLKLNEYAQRLILPFSSEHFLQDYANLLLYCTDREFQTITQNISTANGFRFLASPVGFRKPLQFWRQHLFPAIPANTWEQISQDVQKWCVSQ